ncbi:uncharacterized protein OCT59_015269 [Rhizophagus irregularis]|uniref:uncharacterized protein n=1 Tax=Rhizophagus irregularis TaxID=588596 RepID=UPI00331D10FC|nr:hypothetical protein OCT59_015269 [Rhizophagus irregularis]
MEIIKNNFKGNNFKNRFTSGNKKIDDFIQRENDRRMVKFEWISYNQFIDIEETDVQGFVTAIWKDSSLEFYEDFGMYIRDLNKKVVLKIFNNSNNSQNISYEFLNKVKSYLTTEDEFITNSLYYDGNDNYNYCYGMSQNPDTKDYILVFHEKYLETCCKNCGENYSDNIIFEWIPYNQFTSIQEIGNIGAIAIWKNGPLYYKPYLNKYERKLINENVSLKYLSNILDILDEFLDKVKSKDIASYGMSQNPYTKDYILVSHKEYFEIYCLKCDEEYINIKYKWCKPCQIDFLKNNFINWTSGNKQIDNFIQEKQLQIYNPSEMVFEWIPYNQLTGIQEIENIGTIAIWKNGPLYYNSNLNKYERKLENENVSLSDILDILEVLDKVKSKDIVSYGMSQNPDTKDYILVSYKGYFEKYCLKCDEKYTNMKYKWCRPCQIDYLKSNFIDWTKIKQIEAFIDFLQKEQFKWIPYEQFSDIKEIGNIGATAIWKNKPLIYDFLIGQQRSVALRYLYNLQYISDEFLSMIKSKDITSYGVSQNPDTKDYILVFHEKYLEKFCKDCGENYPDEINKWCKSCQIDFLECNFASWTSGDKQIDCFIQEKRSQIDSPLDIVFEWISYNQFSDIRERENGFAAAVWKDGPLKFDRCSKKYVRNLNRNVALKYLYDFQYITDEFLNKVNSYLTSYGISQNSDTKDYILVFHEKMFENSYEYLNKYLEKCLEEHFEKYCVKCGKEYTSEWIPYNQLSDIKEIGKGGFATVYSAIWNNRKVALKCLHNSQNFIYEFLNEVEVYLAYTNQKFSNILKIYGMSQNSDTEEFIIVLEYAEGGNFNDYLYRNYKSFNWSNKLQILMNIIKGLKEIHQKQMIHRDFHTKNILFKHIEYINICISDMGLCGEVGNIDETKIYGVVAPEVLRGKLYTQAADIYSFGMIMYFVATGSQPFANRAHDKLLALDICNGIRPEINEPRAPKCYIDLMKKCWDSNPNNRPNAVKIERFIWLFHYSLTLSASEFKFFMKIEKEQHYEIEKQFKEAEEYSKENPLFIEDIQSTTHPQAIYTSRLLNHFTKDLPSECLDCEI